MDCFNLWIEYSKEWRGTAFFLTFRTVFAKRFDNSNPMFKVF